MGKIEQVQLSAFHKLRSVNVNEHTEKKNGLTYLSWAWAVDQLLQNDPAANWEYLEPLRFGETMMVRCSVTAFGKTMTSQLPVMNHRNQPIANPDAFQVNTAMQRCLAKAIALHGLGLYIYAGEDVPEDDKDNKPVKRMESSKTVAQAQLEEFSEEEQAFLKEQAMIVLSCLPDEVAMFHKYEEIKQTLDGDEQTAWWRFFDSKSRAALKKGKELELAGQA